MSLEQVLHILQLADENDITLWLDGGWGVDALLESQTRDHNDLDLVIQKNQLDSFVRVLKREGFTRETGGEEWNFVMMHPDTREIDLHIITLKNGIGLYSPSDAYPRYSLDGKGKVGDKIVTCLTASYQVESHTGYAEDENDYKDVKALCERFDLPLPGQYKKWETTK